LRDVALNHPASGYEPEDLIAQDSAAWRYTRRSFLPGAHRGPGLRGVIGCESAAAASHPVAALPVVRAATNHPRPPNRPSPTMCTTVLPSAQKRLGRSPAPASAIPRQRSRRVLPGSTRQRSHPTASGEAPPGPVPDAVYRNQPAPEHPLRQRQPDPPPGHARTGPLASSTGLTSLLRAAPPSASVASEGPSARPEQDVDRVEIVRHPKA
jgi:hypothetical protein